MAVALQPSPSAAVSTVDESERLGGPRDKAKVGSEGLGMIRDTEFARQTHEILHEALYRILHEYGHSLNGYNRGFKTSKEIKDLKTQKACETLIRICQEFIRLHQREVERNINKLELTLNILHQTYHEVVDAMFIEEINWGRIVSLVSFTITVAEKMCTKYPENKKNIVESIEMWLNAIFFHKLQSWMVRVGGWGGLHDKFSQDRKVTGTSSKNGDDGSGAWLPTLAVVGVGAALITALFTR